MNFLSILTYFMYHMLNHVIFYIFVSVPALYQPCSTQCVPPLQCGGGDDTFGPESGRPNRRRTTTTPRTTTITTTAAESSTTSRISTSGISTSESTTPGVEIGNDLEFSRDDVFLENGFGRQWGGGRSDKICRCLPPYKIINFQCQLGKKKIIVEL